MHGQIIEEAYWYSSCWYFFFAIYQNIFQYFDTLAEKLFWYFGYILDFDFLKFSNIFFQSGNISKKFLLFSRNFVFLKIVLAVWLKNIILKGCVKGNKKDIDYCSKYSISRLLIFENNKQLKIIYDSNK